MIMLLSGPPGVGKTLTAESGTLTSYIRLLGISNVLLVAETMRTPLYMMSAGDLGLDSSQVESSLSNVLEMCTKWNAVLLLDEADVFLEQRSTHDLERNKLVSSKFCYISYAFGGGEKPTDPLQVFLRILEYYEGILFLTTNRVEDIDAAFQSRIHISLAYEGLSMSSRRHVWSNLLNATSSGSKKHAFSDKDLDELAVHSMNGREIKNVLKTAKLLANKRSMELGIEHVKTVLAIENRYINKGQTLTK